MTARALRVERIEAGLEDGDVDDDDRKVRDTVVRSLSEYLPEVPEEQLRSVMELMVEGRAALSRMEIDLVARPPSPQSDASDYPERMRRDWGHFLSTEAHAEGQTSPDGGYFVIYGSGPRQQSATVHEPLHGGPALQDTGWPYSTYGVEGFIGDLAGTDFSPNGIQMALTAARTMYEIEAPTRWQLRMPESEFRLDLDL